jgi:hypothetical protein
MKAEFNFNDKSDQELIALHEEIKLTEPRKADAIYQTMVERFWNKKDEERKDKMFNDWKMKTKES